MSVLWGLRREEIPITPLRTILEIRLLPEEKFLTVVSFLSAVESIQFNISMLSNDINQV